MEINMHKISVLIPVYNEEKTLEQIINAVENADFCGLEKEIILIDDCSQDSSRYILKKYENIHKIIFKEKNEGKGSALKIGIKNATGDIIIIQDADLEYDPNDYKDLLKLILENKADVVYGSRLTGSKPSRAFMFHHLLGNKFLTLLTNILYNSTITDMETCYKAFKSDLIQNIKINANKFDFEPEITAKVLKKGARLYELPISYFGRDFKDGKKISWKDGFSAIFTLIKY